MTGLRFPGRAMSSVATGIAIALAALVAGIPLARPAGAATAPFDSTWYGYNAWLSGQTYFLSSLQLGDIDRDGDLDAVASRYWAGFMGTATGFVALRNDGAGAFAGTPAQYNSPLTSQYVSLGDVSGDGYLDVIVSNSGDNYSGASISVYRNLANGTFGAPTTYAVSQGPAGTTVADLDGDGDLDIAVCCYGFIGSGSTLAILFNSGTGAFGAPVNYAAGSAPYRVLATRVSGDAALDLVVANEAGRVNVFLNTGSGAFGARTQYSVGVTSSPSFASACIADVDHDGDQDVLYANSSLGVRLLRNLGGTFAAAEAIAMHPLSSGVWDIDAGDLNNDGWPDLAATSTSARTMDGYQYALNDGAGHFLPARWNNAGQNTIDVAIGDVNDDGWNDIVTADSYSMQVTVHRNLGGAVFPVPRVFDAAVSIAGSLDAADIDADGDLDVVLSASGRAAVGVTVKVMRNLGGGAFDPPVSCSIRGGGVQAKFRDLNGDGFPDVLFATAINSPPYDFHYAINRGDGTFMPVQTVPLGSCGWYDIDAADLDHDGDRDVLLTEWLGCPGIPTSSRRIYVCRNHGDATFDPPIIKVQGVQPGPIAIADFNGDGDPDLATGVAGARIEVSRGLGNCDFASPVGFSIGSQGGATDLVTGDYDGDGRLDIASSNFWETTTMSVLYGNGSGSFAPALILPSAHSPDLLNVAGITSGDVDQDGDPDLIVANNASNSFSLYENRGTTFAWTMRVGGYCSVGSPVCADFDGDERLDIVATGSVPPSGIGSNLVLVKGGLAAATGVSPHEGPQPGGVFSSRIDPNPFAAATTISFRIPETTDVTLKVYNALGQEVATLVRRRLEAGDHHATFAPGDLASGVYFYRVEAGGASATGRMMLAR